MLLGGNFHVRHDKTGNHHRPEKDDFNTKKHVFMKSVIIKCEIKK